MDGLAAIQREAARLMDAYATDPDFIEREYRLPPIRDLLAGEGVLGANRLIQLPAFCTERLHTFIYTAGSIAVTTVRGRTSLWCSLARGAYPADAPELAEWEPEPFVASEADSRSATLPLSAAGMPPELASWAALIEAAVGSPSCRTDTCDGVSYRHRVRSREVTVDADWSNPDPRRHAPQVRLLAAYSQLLGLADLFPEEREEAERRRLRNRENRLARRKRKEERKRRH